jgi:DNA ligase D-like protein (predicted ligase)/DNA ligase D-like protein (predicted 3'-phosphoesterase)
MAAAKTSRRAPLPDVAGPMLCTLVGEPFDNPDWLFERKFDGLRVLVRFDGRELTLLSRNDQPQHFQFPDVVEALRTALPRPMIVDGEVVYFDEGGRTSFRALQQRFHLKNAAEVRARAEQRPAFIHLFDVLYVDGRDVTGLPLSERKELLREAVRWSERVRWTVYEPGGGKALWERACRAGEEGIIGKDARSRYVAGRSSAWVKVKCVGRQEFVIGGFTDPQRSRVGLGALLVGYHEGGRLRYAGKVGTGYTREDLLDLRQRLGKREQSGAPFEGDELPRGGHVHWVRPELVAEIAFAEWTQNGLLRQPRFEGLRTDKAPGEVRRERPRPARPARPDTGDNDMALEEYKAKRDFRKTPEPGPRPAKAHRQPIFVIQEHHASHLHYDFRLEADGVLKSWAVPKQPSLDPAEKRLAVRVEDHPLGYATFEGRIPEGQYGAGDVTVWDHGTYENLLADKATPQTVAEGIDAGRLEFALHGEKLQGRFALIRMRGRQRGKENWLLIKMKDEHARAASGGGAPALRKATSNGKAKNNGRGHATKNGRSHRTAQAPGAVALTHGDKVLFPEAGVTKEDVFEYYRRVSGRLLPFLKDRPVTLERLPDGLGGPHFWQKNTPASYPDWIPRVELETERGKPVHYVLVNNEETLLYLVNQGTITFHPWLSRVGDLDRPDFVLFDLDPGESSFADAVAVAASSTRCWTRRVSRAS